MSFYKFITKLMTVVNSEIIEAGFAVKNAQERTDIFSIKYRQSTSPEEKEAKDEVMTFYKSEIELFWKFASNLIPFFEARDKLSVFEKIYRSDTQSNDRIKKAAQKTLLKHTVLNQFRRHTIDESNRLAGYQIFLMSPPTEPGNYFVSDDDHIRAYRDPETGEFFYRRLKDKKIERHSLDEAKEKLRYAYFNQTGEFAELCTNLDPQCAIQSIVQKRGHAKPHNKDFTPYFVSGLETLASHFQYAHDEGITPLVGESSGEKQSLQNTLTILEDLKPHNYYTVYKNRIGELKRKDWQRLDKTERYALYDLFNTDGRYLFNKPGELSVPRLLMFFEKMQREKVIPIIRYAALYSAKLNQPEFYQWLALNPEHPIASCITPKIAACCITYALKQQNVELAKLIYQSKPELSQGLEFDYLWFLELTDNWKNWGKPMLENNIYQTQFDLLNNFFEVIEPKRLSQKFITKLYDYADRGALIAWIDVLLRRGLISSPPEWYSILPKRPFSFSELLASPILHQRLFRWVFHEKGNNSTFILKFILSVADLCIERVKIKELFEALFLETHSNDEAVTYTVKLLRLFKGDFVKIAKYINQYANVEANQPIHDLCQFGLPNPNFSKESEWDKDFWIEIALRLGLSGLKYAAFAAELEKDQDWQLYKEQYPSASKNKSNEEIRKEIARFAGNVGYKNYAMNPEFADLCLKHGVAPENFNAALAILNSIKRNPHYKKLDSIPDITIFGDELEGFDRKLVFRKVTHAELKKGLGLILGKITKNCQSVGDMGGRYAVYGTLEDTGGFYVLMHQDRFIAQAFIWHDIKTETLCFDSWEGVSEIAKDIFKPLLLKFAEKVFAQDVTIKRITVGTGGRTPAGYFPRDTMSAHLDPSCDVPATDSKSQYLVAENKQATKNVSVTQDGFVLVSAVDTYVHPGAVINTVASEKNRREEFNKEHPLSTGILQRHPKNPLAEEGKINEVDRDHKGEYFLTYEFIALFVYFKIIQLAGEHYDKNNMYVIQEDVGEKLSNLLSSLKFAKEGDNAKIIYVSGVHAQTLYLRQVDGRVYCFVVDSEPSDNSTQQIVQTALPSACVLSNREQLQVDFFSCGTIAIKALMHVCKHGEDVFREKEHSKLPLSLYKLSQRAKPEAKSAEEKYQAAHAATFFNHTYNLAAIRKKYRYVKLLEQYLQKNLTSSEKEEMKQKRNLPASLKDIMRNLSGPQRDVVVKATVQPVQQQSSRKTFTPCYAQKKEEKVERGNHDKARKCRVS